MSVTREQVPLRTAKTWAKRLQQSLAPTPYAAPLAQCQTSVSAMLGFDDWHVLTERLSSSAETQNNEMSLVPAAMAERSWEQAWITLLSVASSQGGEVLFMRVGQMDETTNVMMIKQGQERLLTCWPTSYALAFLNGLGEVTDWAFPLLDGDRFRISRGFFGEKNKRWHLDVRWSPALAKKSERVITIRWRPAAGGKAQSLEALGYSTDQSAELRRMIHGGILVAANSGHGRTTTLQVLAETIRENRSSPQVVWDNEGDWPVGELPPLTSLLRPQWDEAEGVCGDNASAGIPLLTSNGSWVHAELCSHADAAALGAAARKAKCVVAGLHSSGAIGILDRMEDFGISKEVLRQTYRNLTLVYQQLLPVLCSDCSVPLAKNHMSTDAWARWEPYFTSSSHIRRRGQGCAKCRQGATGRTLVAEVIPMTENLWTAWETKDRMRLYLAWHALSDLNPWSEVMRGKMACEHGLSKVLHGQVCPLDYEKFMGRPPTIESLS